MTQALGQFVKTQTGTFADSYAAKDAANNNTPMLVRVNEYKTDLKTKYVDSGEGVSVDLIDLQRFSQDPVGSVFVNVLWMGGAVRDQLKPFVGSGQILPLRLVWQATQNGTGQFVMPEPLEGDWLTYAQQVFAQDQEFIDKVKAAKKAKFDQEQAANPGPQVQAVAPAALPPMQVAAVNSPAPQQPVAAPPAQAAPVQQVAAPPVQAPAMQAPVAAPPVQAPPVAAPPVQPPAMQAPGQPPAAPAMPAAPVQAAGVPPVTNMDVEAMMAKLNQG